MSNDRIRISPKYGLNPAMTFCFWCGKDTGIAIMGRIDGGKRGGDIEAPRRVFGGYEPCDECKEKMRLGTVMIEAGGDPITVNQPEIQKGLYPTGRWLVITKEAAQRLFNCNSDRAFCDRQIFDMLSNPQS